MGGRLPRLLWAVGLVLMAGALAALAAGFIYGYAAGKPAVEACSGTCASRPVVEDPMAASLLWFKVAIWTAVAGVGLAFVGNAWLEKLRRQVEQPQ